MRITGGRLRGRTLVAPANQRIRPTSDKVRQAIFNILAHNDFGTGFALESARVADLFAGMAGYAFAPMANQTRAERIAKDFFSGLAEKAWMDGIIPSRDVTPEQLGMADFVGVDPAEYGARILADDPRTRK